MENNLDTWRFLFIIVCRVIFIAKRYVMETYYVTLCECHFGSRVNMQQVIKIHYIKFEISEIIQKYLHIDLNILCVHEVVS